jgi:CelD/BcsL family acetyltransferase involved in cellulose biosynthesis
MRVELVERDALPAIWGTWDALHRADPLATPFTSRAWAEAWLREWAPDAESWVLAVHDENRIVGLAPLVLRGERALRMLHPLGKEPGDYWDVLAEPGAHAEVGAQVGAYLARKGRAWDAFVVSCFPAGSPTPAALARGGLRIHEREDIPCPTIELPSTFEAYLAMLPRSHRSNLRRHMKRLDTGEIEVREITEPSELPDAIAQMQELRLRQWAHAGKEITAQQQGPQFRAFMTAAVQGLVPAGQAVVWEFRGSSGRLGIYVNFVDAAAFYWYLGGFDPAHARLGLGKIAVGLGIRTSIDAGRARFDFTRGAEPYKYWYGARDHSVASLVVGHTGLRSRAALLAARRLGGSAATLLRAITRQR